MLKAFTKKIAERLEIDHRIKHIDLRIVKEWHGYYPKGKPLGGFKKVRKGKTVRIDLTGHWDKSITMNKEAIVHELTHVKQLIEKRLEVNRSATELKWLGKKQVQWKKFRLSKLDSLGSINAWRYTYKYMPWEKEVHDSIKKYRRVRV